MDRQALSFEMGSRLKALREEKHLSYQELADALLKKYGIKISKDSLRDYEICSDYRSKAKSLPNLGMRTEYLIALSDFYEVSTDYLLCKTDCQAPEIKIREVCEYTGLSEDTVRLLNVASTMGPLVSSFLCRFFEDIVVADSSSVELACSCIYKAAHACVISKTQFAPRSNADAEVNNIIDSINGVHNGMFQISSAEAEGYFLECAKGILKCDIDSIIEDMANELSEEIEKTGLVHIEKGQRIWKLIDDEG